MVRSYYPLVALSLVEGVGPSVLAALSPDSSAEFRRLQSREGLRDLSESVGRKIESIPWREFDAQIERIEKCGVEVVTIFDASYPRYLRCVPEAPPMLLCRGRLECLDRRGVAIVGTRHPTARGRMFAERLARELVDDDVTIVSGLALGIDAAAHRGALDGGGATVAVIGTGLDVRYPRGNSGLRRLIAERGCVVTEQLMGVPPQRFVFPRRNRLISALSHIVVVVEAGPKSGALITTEWALQQGREVGAVPGFPGDARSRGVNALLKSGAHPIESAEDVLAAVPHLVAEADRRKGRTPVDLGGGTLALTPEEARLLGALGSGAMTADDLTRELRRPVADVLQVLFELEMRSLVDRDAAGMYYRVV